MEPDKKGKTLWEMFQERLHGGGNGAGVAFQNPLKLGIGTAMNIPSVNGPEFAQYDFSIMQIREYTRRIGEQDFVFTDYELRGVDTKSFDAAQQIRAFELPVHPFFIGTLFQPERSALSGRRHPLIESFVQAIAARLE